MSKSFLNWIGNKNSALKHIIPLLPKKFNNYYEPFIGSGVLYFYLQHEHSFISDVNSELINTYNVLKDNPNELIDSLYYHENSKEYFDTIKLLDRNEDDFNSLSSIVKASRFIFLNKTSFMYFYKVNLKNKYIGTYNKKNNFNIDEDVLFDCSLILKNTNIQNKSYLELIGDINKEDFVYLDPPYDDNKTIKYNSNMFDRKNQLELREFCEDINTKNGYFMLSNSNTFFIKELYKKYNIYEIKLNNRTELIITNYILS